MAEAVGAVIINGPLALGPELRFQAPPKNHWTRRLPPWTFLASFLAWSMRHLPAQLLRPVLMKFLTTALAPSTNLLVEGALLIDADGRAVNGDRATIPTTVAGAPGNQAWLILDARVAAKFQAWPFYISTAPGIAYAYLSDYARNRPDICRAALSLEELAKLLHVNSDILLNSARTFRRPRIPESGGGASDHTGLESGPFWALGPVKSVFVHSEGGLETDLEHRILNASGDVMLGLYAAGSTGQTGLLLRGHGHHLAWAFSSGRRAGVRASRFARSSD
jgi:fumarate reductase flavoprotein subunit